MSITDEGVIHGTLGQTRTIYKPLKKKKTFFIVHTYYTVKTNTLQYVPQSKGVNILNNLSLKSNKMNENLQCSLMFVDTSELVKKRLKLKFQTFCL